LISRRLGENRANPDSPRDDQVIRENPANRTEASAEFLVGPPWRME
jgi:hypothetical protein